MEKRVLTSRWLEWYFKFRFTELNLENQIHQRFQTRAVAINPNPYQGLKRQL
ncbi:MAG: hypothetical protein RLZZ338_4186 [Cyanobacteriota bacterium]